VGWASLVRYQLGVGVVELTRALPLVSGVLVRFVDDEFDEDTPCTIGTFSRVLIVMPSPYNWVGTGVDYKNTVLEDFHGKKVNLSIWDTAGQGTPPLYPHGSLRCILMFAEEKFRSLTSSYYRGTHGIVVVFDVGDQSSFDNVDTWLNEAQLYAVKCDPVILLIGNKVDKPVSS
jgi:GTPase SAR1 family protein